jgi:plasmid stabilization system protein ParE
VSRYVLSPAARADLEQIWDYTCERWDDDQAEEYVREIQRAIERVMDNPMIGRACDEVRPGSQMNHVKATSPKPTSAPACKFPKFARAERSLGRIRRLVCGSG